MKVLFDFDGVLTEQTEEALRVRELFIEEIAARTGAGQRQAQAWLEAAERAMVSAPLEHGWRVKGRITAFSNEDLFIRNNAAGAALDSMPEFQAARTLLAGSTGEAGSARGVSGEAGSARGAAPYDFKEIADLAFDRMAQETRSGKMHPVDEATREVLQGLLGRGDEVVIVSNSGTERILDLLHGAGVTEAKAHRDAPGARLRVRGGARKFELGDQARVSEVAGYRVETSRPLYESILKEERPGAVVGDVFSLDLALPLHLSRTGELGPVRAFLRERHYTPAWSRQASDVQAITDLRHVLQ